MIALVNMACNSLAWIWKREKTESKWLQLLLHDHLRFGFISGGLFLASILTPARRTGSLTVSTGSEIGRDVLRSSDCRLIKPRLLVRSFQATCYHCRTFCSETTPVKSAYDETYNNVRIFVSVHCCVTRCLPMTACIETQQYTAGSHQSIHFCVSCLVLTVVPVDHHFITISHQRVCFCRWNSIADLSGQQVTGVITSDTAICQQVVSHVQLTILMLILIQDVCQLAVCPFSSRWIGLGIGVARNFHWQGLTAMLLSRGRLWRPGEGSFPSLLRFLGEHRNLDRKWVLVCI